MHNLDPDQIVKISVVEPDAPKTKFSELMREQVEKMRQEDERIKQDQMRQQQLRRQFEMDRNETLECLVEMEFEFFQRIIPVFVEHIVAVLTKKINFVGANSSRLNSGCQNFEHLFSLPHVSPKNIVQWIDNSYRGDFSAHDSDLLLLQRKLISLNSALAEYGLEIHPTRMDIKYFSKELEKGNSVFILVRPIPAV